MTGTVSRNGGVIALLVAVWLCVLLAMPSLTAAAKIDRVLEDILAGAIPSQAIPVVVRMVGREQAGPQVPVPRLAGEARRKARAELIKSLRNRASSQQGALREFLARRGLEPFRELWLINGLAVAATPGEIRNIAILPGVASVQLDQVITLSAPVAPLAVGTPEPNVALTNADDLWSLGYHGEGVTIGFMDGGVDASHPDLQDAWRGGSNSWYDPYGQYSDEPFDPDGHGTLVTGLAVGGDADGTTIGVAPGAKWIAAKIFDDTGGATFSAIHQGFQWLLDPDGNPETDDAPDIVNNSWGFENEPDRCDDYYQEFRLDLQELRAAGIAVVFSAGNSGPGSDTSIAPASYPESFAVGSVGSSSSELDVSDFSARGPSACDGSVYPELVAPGYLVWSTYLQSSYALTSGTSFSAPHISGVMALLLSAFPAVTLTQLEDAMRASAVDLGPLGPDNDYGYGLVSASAAFDHLAGLQDVSLTDTTRPETDGKLQFGHVSPGSQADGAIRVRNTGSLTVTLLDLDVVGVTAPFSILLDGCSGKTLPVGESCEVRLRFAPDVAGDYRGSLAVRTPIAGRERLPVELNGVGNTPPVAPQPLTPADGAEVGTTVTLTWVPGSDTDGDALTQYVVYSPHPDFVVETVLQVDGVPALLLGAGGLMVGGVIAGWARRRRSWVLNSLLLGLLLTLFACGGGGSTAVDDGGTLPSDSLALTLTSLSSGTTYYWKMRARDSWGAETESTVRAFTVQ